MACMDMGNGEPAGAEYAQDGSMDMRGNPVLRSKRGGWTACSFIVGAFVRRSFDFLFFLSCARERD
jgi:hypothetical protein